MNRRFRIVEKTALTLIGLLLTGGPLWAQAGNPYPYWGSAPSGYRPADNMYLPPGMSPGYYSRSAFGSPGYGMSYSPYFGTTPGDLSGITGRADLLARLPGGPHLPRADNKAYIWLSVPADAQVWFDDDKTKQTGEFRHFYTGELTPGKEYAYTVRIRWMKDGKAMERTRKVTVRAKDRIHLDFLDHEAETKEATTQAEKTISSATAK
jgi:uncharacterized protein (TIGR03000 family)